MSVFLSGDYCLGNPVTSTQPVLARGLSRLYEAFNAPESALDPSQIVRRYPRLEDREVVAFIAAGLAFGRVASVMASIEQVCRVLGPAPGAALRQFDPARDGEPLRARVHRWTRGDDFVALPDAYPATRLATHGQR